ncbi:MAG: Fe-S cluster assembly protein SufD [Pseudobdellovibrio sp.]
MNLGSNGLENLKKSMPTRSEEAWKYTSLTDFKKVSWNFKSDMQTHLSHDQLLQLSKHLPSDFYNIVFVNGDLNQTLSDNLGADVEINNILDTDLVVSEKHVEKNVLKFANVCLKNKITVTIQEGRVFEKPLHLLFVSSEKVPYFLSQKVDIQVGKKSELSILTQSINLDETTQNGFDLNLNLNIQENSNVKLIQIQNENSLSYHFAQTEIKLLSNSFLTAFTMSLGGLLSRHYMHLEFVGQNADAGVFGLTALNTNQHSDHYTFIQHSVGGNNSKQLYKSILSDASHSVFRGRVRIEQDAQKANSEQLNNNLLLTREAQADSIPQLEIYADDVKAGHGSTVGQLDKEEIFYFLSRGINQFEAVKILSFGYAQELIYKFENKAIQEWLLKIIHQKLDRMISHV